MVRFRLRRARVYALKSKSEQLRWLQVIFGSRKKNAIFIRTFKLYCHLSKRKNLCLVKVLTSSLPYFTALIEEAMAIKY